MAPERRPLLAVSGLRIAVPGAGGPVDVVRGVDLRLARGEALGLVGESGSGKTLTCRAVLGLLPRACAVSGGSIAFDGLELVGLGERGWRELHGGRIGAVFQDPGSYLNPSLTIGRQLEEALRAHRATSRRVARARAAELLEEVELRPQAVIRKLSGELSGGMQQRVMLAIAICCDPDLLVADEPTSALDVKTQAEILALLRGLRERTGLALLFVSHDLAVVSELCERVAVFHGGDVVEQGATHELLRGPRHEHTRALLAGAALDTAGTHVA